MYNTHIWDGYVFLPPDRAKKPTVNLWSSERKINHGRTYHQQLLNLDATIYPEKNIARFGSLIDILIAVLIVLF